MLEASCDLKKFMYHHGIGCMSYANIEYQKKSCGMLLLPRKGRMSDYSFLRFSFRTDFCTLSQIDLT